MPHWDELTKKQKKHIREIAGVAYEREMAAALDTLLAVFQKWKKGTANPFDVNEAIHKYHDGRSRDLYKQYVMGDADMAVMLALARGALKIEELNEDCRAFYQERVDRLRDRQE